MSHMIAPRNALEFEQTFSLREKGETLVRVSEGRLFCVPCFTGEEEVQEQGAASKLAGMGRNINPYPRGDKRRSFWNLGFSGKLV